MRIRILALDGIFDTGLSTFLDTLSMANELRQIQGSEPLFDVGIVGVRRHVRTAQGLSVSVAPVGDVGRVDWILVPALNTKQPASLVAALQRKDVREAKAWLRERHDDGIHVAAACVGTFLLADSGLLDGREATTSWPLAPLFRQRYPSVRLDDSRMIVVSQRIVTAGALMGHLDLVLWLVRQASPQLATQVARVMLVDRRESQAQYIIPDFVAHADPLVARFERWARERLSRGFSLQEAADALHVHSRTLQRKTERVLGKSPMAFFQDLRIERVRQLVASGCDLGTIAGEVGYADAATVGNLLRRKLGQGVRSLRADSR